MNLQGRNLQLNLNGNDVQLLHTELAQIGLPVPDDERQRALFWQGTHDAVVRFQQEHRACPDWHRGCRDRPGHHSGSRCQLRTPWRARSPALTVPVSGD